MTRRFAEDTSVPISRSRGEIDTLLRQWGAGGVQWTDEWERDLVTLRFTWKRDDLAYLARFTVALPSRKDLEPEAIHGRTGMVNENKLEKLMEARGRREHRLLLLWLKAALNAVEAGIVPAEAIFLPFLQGADGKTVAEVAIAKLPMLQTKGALQLLSLGAAP